MPVEKTTGRDEEWPIPQVAQSPITGAVGALSWGALNKPGIATRNVIGDAEADELVNWFPLLYCWQQVPAPGANIATLASPMIWSYSDILNGNLFAWYLCQNGHIYQVSVPGGTITDLGGGFSTAANSCDCVSWQGTALLISDFVAQKIYSWNGSVLTTLLTSQPANYIAVYAGRLWLAKGLAISWTAAGTNNSFGGDSGTYLVTDGHNVNPIIGMIDYAGSLYIFGSNWIKTINSLADTGSPPVLTFQQVTTQAQVSIINKWSVVLYGGQLYFANSLGFWVLNGNIPVKISQPLDGFFQNIDPNSSFSAAYGQIYSTPCIFWACRWLGDGDYTVFGYTVNQQWFRVVATPGLGAAPGACQFITGVVSSATVNNVPVILGCDGTGIFNLFGSTTAPVTSQYNSKTWDILSKLTFDKFTSVALQLFIQSQTTITIAEIGSNGQIQGPAQQAPSGSGIGSQSYTYNPALGNFINQFGVQGPAINNTAITGQMQGVLAQPFYVLNQSVVPFEDRNISINVTVTGSRTVLQALVLTYRKSQAAKG